MHHPWFNGLPDRAVIAHRGAAGHRPENTLPAFEHALELGAHALEFDVQCTRDGQVVVIHDPTVDRTTNGTGRVADLTLADLKKLNADVSKPWNEKNAKIQTLEEVLNAFPNARMVIELKGQRLELVDRVLSHVRNAHAAERVLLSSFEDKLLQRVRRQEPDIATGSGRDEVTRFVFASHARLTRLLPIRYQALQVPTHHKQWRVVFPALIRQARARGLHIQVWTINDPAEMRALYDLGVHAVTTDFPDRARAILSTHSEDAATPSAP